MESVTSIIITSNPAAAAAASESSWPGVTLQAGELQWLWSGWPCASPLLQQQLRCKHTQQVVSVCKCKEHSQQQLHLTYMNAMKLVIPLHFISGKKDSKRCCDTTTPESIHTKDESKRGSAFAFIFGVN